MRLKEVLSVSLLCMGVVSINLQAQSTIYLSLGSDCADELEYLQATTGQRSRGYSLNFSNEQYVFFTTDSGVSVASLPAGAVTCRNLALDQALVDAVNSGAQPMTVVSQMSDKSYQLLPVTSLMQVIKSGSYYVIRDKDFVAAIDTSKLVYESNLAGPGSAGNVFLTGLKVYDCKVLYALRTQPAEGRGDEAHFDFTPVLGIVSVSKGLTPSALQYNRTDLVRVNNYDLSDWIARMCGSPITPPISTPVTPPAGGAGVKYHTVASGETLNSIARANNIPVNSLMIWNNINNPNMIKKGQQLIVSDPGTVAPPVSPGISGKPGGANGGAKPGATTPPTTKQATYIIKQGDKVADVAAQFGYTEAYFRKMNSLPPRIELAAGTELIASDCPCARTFDAGATGAHTPATHPQDPLPTVARQDNPATTPAKPATPSTDIRFIEYTVKQGDTMAGLATQYKIDVKELAYLNSKRVDERLVPGQKLYIPVSQ
ncbi:MAG: LysM peptidoglycan-binding domain-containing protein [Saprospiraceae bacterium]|nr:LysM peptidoglycan-binding domain-containing protein [Saprospiraceae bacterium]